MKWIEVEVITNTYGSELVADIMSDYNSEGVAILDSNDLAILLKSDIIWDYIDEQLLIKSEKVIVKTCFSKMNFNKNYKKLLIRLDKLNVNADHSVGSLETTYHEIDDQDWVNVWKKYYTPIHVGGVIIVPQWLNYILQDGELPVYIDPGMAFGTGEHETTRMCIILAEKYDVVGKTVLDIGCGSGILGISAAVRGANTVYMSDIDPIAIESANANCIINPLVQGKFVLVQDDLVAKAEVKGDIIFANITADILIRLSNYIGKCLNEDGVIILSGIIKMRYDEVLNAYLNAGYKLIKSAVMGEWCALSMRR